MLFQMYMNFILLLNTEVDILKNLGNHSMEKML